MTENDVVWFAMSAPYCKELEAQILLQRDKIESFVPLCYKIVEKKDGHKVRKLVPAIHNLIFVKTTRPIIQEAKQRIAIIQYLTKPENGKNVPIIVPERQMQQFITVCKSQSENLVYLSPTEVNLHKGTRVRIIGGPFDGVEGIFIKLKGYRKRRIVVSLPGLAAVATAEIDPDYIQIIRNN